MLVAAPCLAASAELADFFGRFEGVAIASAETSDGSDPKLSIRNLDVSVGQAGRDGFWIDWQTLIRSTDESGPQYRRKSTRLEFERVREGVYRGPAGSGGQDAQYMSWASLIGEALTVYELSRQAEGRFDLSTYRRTLTDSGMALEFSHLRNGERVRRVEAELRRVAGG
jgi:hypothetical protein